MTASLKKIVSDYTSCYSQEQKIMKSDSLSA